MTTLVYLAMGITWTVRSAQEVVLHPDYWDPRTTSDWFAVWSFSLALTLTGLAVVLLVRSVRAGRTVDAIGWVTAGAAILAAVGNAIEDAIGVSMFGTAYVVGALGLLAGLIVLGVALAAGRHPRHAVTVALWATGLAGMTWGLGFLVLIGSLVAIASRRDVSAAV